MRGKIRTQQRRSALTARLLPAALLPLALAACTSGAPDSAPPAPRSPWPASSGPATVAPPAESPVAVGEPDLGETFVAGLSDMQGDGAFAFDAGRRGEALIVAYRCLGPGELTVEVRPTGMVRSVPCTGQEVADERDVVDVEGVQAAGRVYVQAPSTVRWAVSVGRGERAALDVA
ncbi:hypothetical protein [Streptomyces sp. NPDC060194]|uniref:hypothetical protein n=1 Tax=Streptomyces sp. NPDC060194 TaxID=3347069 RepID=UPI0036493C51